MSIIVVVVSEMIKKREQIMEWMRTDNKTIEEAIESE